MSRWPNKYVIGLTGNIGVGKSVVRQMLQHSGAYTIDADSLAHQVMMPNAPAYKPIHTCRAGVLRIDPTHTTAGFSVKHMMFTTVRGKFNEVEGFINFDPENPGAASVEAHVKAHSIFTGVGDRDNHLRSGDFFDATNYGEITFKSTRVENATSTKARVIGDLTIRGVTKEVALDVEYLGTGKNPWGATVAGFNATATINREDFGLTWNQALEAGGILVGRDVKLELDVQAAQVTENVAS